jgi:Zn-dependent protease
MIIETIYLAIIFMFSITIHEFAHARTANYFWDPTPRLQNRLNLNPINHIDPLWFLLIFIIKFWWGKPVEINPHYFKNPVRDEFFVAIAWPISNVILLVVSILIVIVAKSIPFLESSIQFRQLFWVLNAGMAVFNMIPLPALDWFRVIKLIIPKAAELMQYYTRKYSWISFILIYMIAQFLSPFIWSVTRSVYLFFYVIISSLIG